MKWSWPIWIVISGARESTSIAVELVVSTGNDVEFVEEVGMAGISDSTVGTASALVMASSCICVFWQCSANSFASTYRYSLISFNIEMIVILPSLNLCLLRPKRLCVL